MHLFSFLFRNFAENMQIFLAYVRILEEPTDTFHQMNNLKKKALFGWIADLTSIQYVFQLTAFLPLLGITAYFLPNIKE